MKKEVYYSNRKKLRELNEQTNSPYKTNEEDYDHWFSILNNQIFNDKLSRFDKLHIGRTGKAYALFECNTRTRETKLILNHKYPSKKVFVNILFHEMIHLYQFHHREPLGHGPSFWCWKDHAVLNGLILKTHYEH